MTTVLRISRDDVARFAEWSKDCNPLHVDEAAARQTYFGEPIAHGMLSALRALDGALADSRPLLLDIEFKGAVRRDTDYLVETTDDAGGRRVLVKGTDGGAALAVRTSPAPDVPEGFDTSWITADLAGRSAAYRLDAAQRTDRELEQMLEVSGVYAPAGGDASARARALALCSYVVGMEIPGLKSLFTRASLTFTASPGGELDAPPLAYRARAVRFDCNFRMLDVRLDVATVDGRPVASGALRVYVRFSPTVADVDALRARLSPAARQLAGRTALVCGGTRGLGADISTALALAGCRVFATYHQDVASAETLRDRVCALGASIEVLQGDAGDPEWCAAALDRVLARDGRLDLLVLSACAPPSPLRVGPATAAQADAYVASNLRLVRTPLAAWLPALQASRGAMAYLSSSFVDELPPGFGHYVSVKQAGEALVRSVVRESDGVSGLIARPPRLRTRWNDTPAGVLGSIAPDLAASHLVNSLAETAGSSDVRMLVEFPALEPASPAPDHTEETAPPALTLGVAATFTTDPLLPGLRFWFRELRLDGQVEQAPYGQVLQALLDPASVLAGRGRGANLVFLRVCDWLRELPEEHAGDDAFVRAHLERASADFISGVRAHRARAGRPTFIILCPSDAGAGSAAPFDEQNPAYGMPIGSADEYVGRVPRSEGIGRERTRQGAAGSAFPDDERDPAYGRDDERDPAVSVDERTPVYSEIERRIEASLSGVAGLTVVRAADSHERYGVREADVHDPLRDAIGHIPFKDAYYHLLATVATRRVHATLHPPRKVVVVDADNTLWRGVVGEVGAAGVVFDEGHRALHAALGRLVEGGVLVALCSKNEEDDVWDVFATRSDLGLRRDQIVGAAINWQPKPQNLHALASRLNVGLDSFIFIDDNPVECAEVRAACPEVLTLEWPQDADAAIRLLQHTWELDLGRTTAEDAQRTEMYRQELQRQTLRDSALTLADFLRSLDLVVDVAPVAAEDVRRVAQLTLRTNQFNFTTRRRDESEMQALLAAGRHDVRVARVRDRFGDYGLVGLVIAARDEEALIVDTWLLSCRVLGRGVEHRIASELGRMALAGGASTVRLRVDFTKKNTPARQFLQAIVPEEFLTVTDTAAEAVVPAEWLAALQFEPAAAADGEAAAEDGEGPAAGADDTGRLRAREAQIRRAATELGTVDGLAAAIGAADGPGRLSAVAGDAGDIAASVAAVFASALGIDEARVRAIDRLEALGCDSLKIVEITVELTSRFPSLPPTLLFEHRSVSEIVAAIAALSGGGDGPATKSPATIASADAGPTPSRSTDVAVVGMHVRCAGANGPDELWNLLGAGRRAVEPVPVDRPWFLHPLRDTRPHWAGLLSGVDAFDPELFGISPREAELMDPQGRLLLEVAWGALEDAGCAGAEGGSDAGVFVGVMYGDYGRWANDEGASGDSPYKCWEGFSVANRLSQALDFHGPSLTVDTACSSSGTALHLACRALAAGECGMALVGGVNLILDPQRFVQLGRLGILSATGRCDAFGADADGTVLGEGAGVVVLRPLDDALRRGDRIYGVIKGTGVSTGSGTTGFTVPNPQAQAMAIRRALAAARVDPRTVSYVETHGTGTSLGDPIEVRGLSLAYGDAGLQDSRIGGSHRWRIGSIKPNVGHLEAGAAVLGLIKVLLQMQRRTLLPSVTSVVPNPQIAPELGFDVQRTLEPWSERVLAYDGERRPAPRRAGLSSFGVGGANVHVIVEEAPAPGGASRLQPAASAEGHAERPVHVVTVSATNDESLSMQASALADWLDAHPNANIADVAFSLNTGRRHFDRRLAFTGGDATALAALLRRVVAGEHPAGCARGTVDRSGGPLRTAFLFTGQGSQHPGMGAALYETQPVFRDAIDRCAVLLGEPKGSTLTALVCSRTPDDGHLIHETEYTQPALFAFEYAMAELWRSWGIEPDFVIGHSVGEIAALCVAGAVPLDAGLALVAARGRLMQALPPGGAMVSVMASEDAVSALVTEWRDAVAIAAVNAPDQTVISGEGAAVAQATARLTAHGVEAKPLTVSHAFHSPSMRPAIPDFLDVARRTRFTPPRIPVMSCVTGAFLTESEVAGAEYWTRQILDTVRFADAIRALDAAGANTYIEVGPHPVLLGLGRQSIQEERRWLPSRRRDVDGWPTLLAALSALYVRGVEIDWKAFDAPYARRLLSLPTYAFRRKRFWLSANVSRRREMAPVRTSAGRHAAIYHVTWERAAGSRPTPSSASARWLIVGDADGFGTALVRTLKTQLVDAAVVEPDHVHDALQAGDGARPLGVVYLGAFGLPSLDAGSATSQLARAMDEAGRLAGALAQREGEAALWLVTRGAQPVATGDPCSATQAALWGLGRTAAFECSGLPVRLVDLASAAGASDAGSLAAELLAADEEEQVALRDGGRFVARLTPLDAQARPAASVPIRADGAYLVTGGAGAIGLHAARWLASRGAGTLVLAGRRLEPGSAAASTMRGLAAGGVSVEYVSIDVSRADEVKRLVARFGVDLPVLRGIVHAAGVERTGAIDALSPEDAGAVFAAKVEGARLLDLHTRDLPLDLFIACSSMASVLGSVGRAHYAAANAALDALAFDRRRRGLPALTVNWGPWSGGGMATEESLAQFARVGNYGLRPDDALDRLNDALGAGVPQAAIADIDWTTFRAACEARRAQAPALLMSLARQDERTQAVDPAEVAAGEPNESDAGHLQTLTPEHRLEAMTMLLRRELAQTLGASPGDLDVHRRFTEQGLDSLLSAELSVRIRKATGIDAAARHLFDHPTIAALAERLAGALPAAPAAAASDGVVRYAAGMEEDVFVFQREAFPNRRRDWIAPRWRWMFLRSAERLGVPPQVWLHRHENRIVGHNGGIPVRLKVGAETMNATWLVDTHVLEPFREQAVGSQLMLAAHEDLPFAISLGQTPQMREIQHALGWKQVAPLRTAMLLVRPERVLKGKLPAPVALAAGLGLRASSAMRSALREEPSGDVRPVDRFGASHDMLWERMSRDLTCAVVRDASHLNWKYVDQPGREFVRLELVDGETVEGVVVLMIVPPGKSYGYTRGFIVDVVAPLSNDALLDRLLRAAVKTAVAHGSDAVICLHTESRLTCALRRERFQLRKPGRYLLVHPGRLDGHVAAQLVQENAWLVTHGDSDIDRPW